MEDIYLINIKFVLYIDCQFQKDVLGEIAILDITALMPTNGNAIRVLNVLQKVISVFQEDAHVLWIVVLQSLR